MEEPSKETAVGGPLERMGRALDNLRELRNFTKSIAEAAKLEAVVRYVEKHPESKISNEISDSLGHALALIESGREKEAPQYINRAIDAVLKEDNLGQEEREILMKV